jgi:hypothetical protein
LIKPLTVYALAGTDFVRRSDQLYRCRTARTSPTWTTRSHSYEVGDRGSASVFDYSTAIYAERST